jgi:anti-sigma-K factor RskA
MTGPPQHSDCRESLGAYALGALSDAEARGVERHLESCQECRADLDWLRAAVDALPASVTQIEPPPELKQRVMQIVEAEAALLRAAGHAADEPVRPTRERLRPFTGRRLALAAAVAAACVAAIVIPLEAGGAGTRVIPARITASALVGRVRATLRVRGEHAQLVLAGLPAPGAGHVEELWVEHGLRAPTPAGTFVLQTGTVNLSRPVRSGDLVLVTVEPGRGTSRPTTPPLLVARV